MSALVEPTAAPDVELLLFEIGPERYGVDASQVLRIDRSGPDALAHPQLGALTSGRRALVCKTSSGEAKLRVDTVLGVQLVAPQTLRRPPRAAASRPYAIGFWLDGPKPVALIDLRLVLDNTQSIQGRQ
jgi:chemotaxis signal transduction protein